MISQPTQLSLFTEITEVTEIPEDCEVVLSDTLANMSLGDFEDYATNLHSELEKTEAFADRLKSEAIRRRGELYMAYKAKCGHGEYMNWLEKIGVSARNAQYYVDVIVTVPELLSNANRGSHLSFRTYRKIAGSPEHKQISAKISSGELAATSKSIDEEIKAAKSREESARKKAQEEGIARVKAEQRASDATGKFNQQLLVERKLEADIAQLKLKLESTPAPVIIEKIVEVIPDDVTKNLAALKDELAKRETDLEARTRQRDNLKREFNKQKEIIDSRRPELPSLSRDGEIRDKWRMARASLLAGLAKSQESFPSPAEAIKAFDDVEWYYVEEMKHRLGRFLSDLQVIENARGKKEDCVDE